MSNKIIRLLKVSVVLAFTAAALLIVFLSPAIPVETAASSGGAPTGRTGAPGESTCTSCHSQVTPTGQFNIVAPANYVPGQTYAIEVRNTTTDQSRLSWGFELTSLTGANLSAGSYANSTANTRVRSANGKSYVTQTTAGTFPGQAGGSVWTFNWTAPATDVGPITFYAAGMHADDDGGTDGDQTYTRSAVAQPSQPVVIHHGFADFDGDGKADPSVFRPSSGIWYLNRSTAGFTGMQLGMAGDHLVPADFDGDEKADIAVWREGPPDTAAFYILQSSTGTIRIDLFGQTGDDPRLVGDWDGDGKADPAVYRDSAVGSQSYFYYRGSNANPGGNITFLPWGSTADIPMRGDFDGDGKFDPAILRPSNRTWYIRRSATSTVSYDHWGLPTDTFVTADYDGDGRVDPAVFRGGIWYIKQSSNGQAIYLNWGLSSDIPVPADYDADGKADAAVFRNGVWYIRQSGNGTLRVDNFGLVTDEAVPNAFVR